jgi:uncharacterized protein (TIGR00290 family)
MLEAQVQRLGLPLSEIALTPACTNDEYEAAFHCALNDIKRALPGVRQIAFGDLFLEDVRLYREKLLADTGLDPICPLWGMDTALLAKRFIDDGFGAHLVCVDTTQLDASFAGRAFDDKLLADLPSTVDPCGERGEFHTFVWGGPQFREAVPYRLGERVLREDRFMYCDVE